MAREILDSLQDPICREDLERVIRVGELLIERNDKIILDISRFLYSKGIKAVI